jgi:DNA-binding MarR family transcriptional regulator
MPHRVDVARSVEQLRLAEAKLARRRAVQAGLGDTDRAALRFVLECCGRGDTVTPSAIATELSLSPAAVTSLVDRLVSNGLVTQTPNPDDRRSKLIEPVDPSLDRDEIDPLTARIRAIAGELTGRDAFIVSAFLERVAEAVTATSPGTSGDDAT